MDTKYTGQSLRDFLAEDDDLVYVWGGDAATNYQDTIGELAREDYDYDETAAEAEFWGVRLDFAVDELLPGTEDYAIVAQWLDSTADHLAHIFVVGGVGDPRTPEPCFIARIADYRLPSAAL